MRFALFVTGGQDRRKIPVFSEKATEEDLQVTVAPPRWQTDWTSDYIRNSGFDLYAFKTQDGELIALGAYEICVNTVAVHIVYMESQSDSNPVISNQRKYSHIGRAMIAFGIKLSVDAGFNGDVTLDTKTSELEEHYSKTFGAIKLPGRYPSAAPRYLICDAAARDIFTLYLEEE